MGALRRTAVVVGLLLLPAACGSDQPSLAAGAGDAESDAAGVTVATADSDLGTILVDGDGQTVYLFESDTGEEGTCTDDCAQTWPPLAGPAEAGEGVDEGELGTTERDDGTTQVTYTGHPLYYYASDEAPGDTNGQGVGDVWYAVTPEGEAASTTAGGGDGY